MPVFNGAAHIAEAIRAIQGQTMEDWELIIVDDASTDTTSLVVAEFLDDDRISYFRLPNNSGSGYARNLALRKSGAPFIAPVDADDISLPQRFQLELRAFEEEPELVAVSGQMLWFNSDWRPAEKRTHFSTSCAEVAAGFARGRMSFSHPACMYRKDAALLVGGYDEACRRSQDLALFLKLADRPMRSLDATLIRYRSSKRPSFQYIYNNDRYGFVARQRNVIGGTLANVSSEPPRGPRGMLIAIIAVIKWLRVTAGLNPRARRTRSILRFH